MAGDAPHYHRDLSHLTWHEVWERQARRAPLAPEWWTAGGGRPGLHVADLGCGPGYFTLHYAQWTGPQGSVLALDANPDAIAHLQTRAPPPNLHTLVLDAADAGPHLADRDLLLLTDVLHHADDPQAILRALKTGARSGARLVIAEFDPEGPGDSGPPREARIPQARLLAWVEEAGFRIDLAKPQRHEHYLVVAQAP